MTFWFMRHRQGSDGEDFTDRLWPAQKVGVLFGQWRISEVLDSGGKVDSEKIDPRLLARPGLEPKLNDTFLGPVKTFLINMKVGDRVIVVMGNAIHLATIDDGFCEEGVERGRLNEFFKCRPIKDTKRFPLGDLPSVYRLMPMTGRGTIQKVVSLLPQVHLLDRWSTAHEVKEAIGELGPADYVSMLSPDQWEAICAEYLRDKHGFRFLLLQPGRTLPDVDLVGLTADYSKRILAQCKNGSMPVSANLIQDWISTVPRTASDLMVFFPRGGVHGRLTDTSVEVVTGSMIAGWLSANPEYFQCLKTM